MERMEITLHPGTNAIELAAHLCTQSGIKATCAGNRLTIVYDPERYGARQILEIMRQFRRQNNPSASEWPTRWPTEESKEYEFKFKTDEE